MPLIFAPYTALTLWVQQGSALHDDAARRQTTLYIPEGHVTMFPADLAEQCLSLSVGRGTVPALSMGVILTETGAIGELQVVASTVRVTYRLTYDHVDEMLYDGMASEGGEEWELGRLAHYARASTQLVTELMIMSGEGMAKLVVVELLLPVYDTTTTHATHTTVTQSKLHCEQQQAKSK
eukprot:2475-Heterococcus_DN1.PRE.1